jgi:hypothetical protein
MGYQYIENLKNARELIIREYEDTNYRDLPDERYNIQLKYYDNAQLIEERKAYDVQIKSFEVEVQHIWDVLEMVYEDKKLFKRITDYSDLAKLNKNKIKRKIKNRTGDPLYEDIDKVWDEISFIQPAETQVEKMNRTYLLDKDKINKQLTLMKDKLQNMYGYRYPVQRRVMEERLQFLQEEFNKFDYMINPYHIQPGLLLDVDITSIKRKKATLDGMANVLNEFLHGVSKGFQDAAFASFSRRRSTVREDIDQHFSSDLVPGAEDGSVPDTSEKGKGYLDMLNASSEGEEAGEVSTVVREEKKSPAGRKKTGPGKNQTEKKRGRPRRSKGDGMKSL